MRGQTLVVLVLVTTQAAGCLDYATFLDRKADKYCEELAKCNPDIPCTEPSGLDTGYFDEEDCDFDAHAARQCLKGTWTCDDRFAGFEYPIGPQACESVCGGL